MQHLQFILNSPLGPLAVRIEEGMVVAIDYVRKAKSAATSRHKPVSQLQQELVKYFKDPMHRFEVPLKLRGTAFQQRVWREMQRIPAGQTRTYGEVAQRLNSSPRAVGNACRANPVPIIVPCHRIIAKGGPGGYGGETAGRNLRIKTWLLRHEGVSVES